MPGTPHSHTHTAKKRRLPPHNRQLICFLWNFAIERSRNPYYNETEARNSGVIFLKCLFLSTATGQGHNSAAAAIAEYMKTQGCKTEFLDILNLGKRDYSRPVSKLYANITVHTPLFFKALYLAGERVSSSRRRSPIYYLNALCAGRLLKEIQRIRPDVIACTHIFSAQAVTCLREKYGLKIPAAGVATDYTCIPFWEESRLDAYVIPAPALTDEFAEKGIPRGKIIPIGIPVRAQFQKKLPKQEARAEFGLTAGRIFVVMGGSMGYGDLRGLARELLAAVPDSQVAVLCGNNPKKLRDLTGAANVIPFEYIDTVGDLMDSADVILTKPGGLSSTEALVKRIPTVLTRPIPGCEQRNAEYLASLGAAAYAGGNREAAREARRLACDPAAAAKMIQAQEKYIAPGADRQIGDFLMALGKSSAKG